MSTAVTSLATHDQAAAAPNPGLIAPQESPSTQQTDIGPNNEQLKKQFPEVAEALRSLVNEYKQEGVAARRNEIMRIRRNRLFWDGIQYAWWNAAEGSWQVPFGANGLNTNEEDKDLPDYLYITNFYLGYALDFIAVLSGDVPNVRTKPEDADSLEDITAAKAADDVVDLIESNNNPYALMCDIGRLLWTDGKIGGYTRYIADAQRFGSKPQPQIASQAVPMGEASYRCPQCNRDIPESQTIQDAAPAEAPADGPPTDMQAAQPQPTTSCPQCGAALDTDDFQPAENVNVPVTTGVKQIPNGQEVISIIGGLELNTPVWATEQHEFPYLQWQMEAHRSKLQATYPHIRDKIQAGTVGSAEDQVARNARLTVDQGLPVIMPGDALQNLITYSRTWIRPWAFESVEDQQVRTKLLELFPDGCYVAFCGDEYAESRCEKMDDYWRVLHAMPGDGQNRQGVGDPLIDPQKRYNTASNIAMETYEHGIPCTYLNDEQHNKDAIGNQTNEPGATYFIRTSPGQTVAQSVYQTAPSEVAASMPAYAEQLAGPIAQQLTGMLPAVYGGEMAEQKTASGYAMARDQAMGRIGLIWRRLKPFWADLMMMAVDRFRENRTDDEKMSVLQGDQWKAQVIRVADLQGNIQIVPEGDETFPRLQSQKRAQLLAMLTTFKDDPEMAKSAMLPKNQETIKNLMGIPEWDLPDEEARLKQMGETSQLLQVPPQQMIQPGPNGMPQLGQQTTIPIDPLLDDNQAEFAECLRFANSAEGLQAKQSNPAGFANFRMHAQAHKQAIDAAQAPQNKPPSESIALKDLPPSGQVQMAAQAGIQLNPAELMAQQIQDRQDKADQLKAKMASKNAGPPIQ